MVAPSAVSPRVGVAFASYVGEVLRANPGVADYVEVAYEALRHDAGILSRLSGTPVVLHCSSLSLAGSLGPGDSVVAEVRDWLTRTKSPWLGEHLSFISAPIGTAKEAIGTSNHGDNFELGYTVGPPMNAEAVSAIGRRIRSASAQFDVPLIVENAPIYFAMPGTTMSQPEFIQRICAETRVGLIFDISHALITCRNAGLDPFQFVSNYPVERVVEVHISGNSRSQGCYWDDHAKPADELTYELFDCLLDRATPSAVTLEYNWSSQFPPDFLVKEIERTRGALACKIKTPAALTTT